MPAFFVERRKKGLALLRFLHGQLDTATLIHVENLHLDQVALIDVDQRGRIKLSMKEAKEG